MDIRLACPGGLEAVQIGEDHPGIWCDRCLAPVGEVRVYALVDFSALHITATIFIAYCGEHGFLASCCGPAPR